MGVESSTCGVNTDPGGKREIARLRAALETQRRAGEEAEERLKNELISMTEQRDQRQGWVHSKARERDDALAKLAKATKALEPFAALYDEVAEDFPDEVAHAMFATEFGHLRAAADALAAIREVPNG